MNCLALVSKPSVVCRLDSGPRGTISLSFSKQFRRWALRFFSSSLWVVLQGKRCHQKKYSLERDLSRPQCMCSPIVCCSNPVWPVCAATTTTHKRQCTVVILRAQSLNCQAVWVVRNGNWVQCELSACHHERASLPPPAACTLLTVHDSLTWARKLEWPKVVGWDWARARDGETNHVPTTLLLPTERGDGGNVRLHYWKDRRYAVAMWVTGIRAYELVDVYSDAILLPGVPLQCPTWTFMATRHNVKITPIVCPLMKGLTDWAHILKYRERKRIRAGLLTDSLVIFYFYFFVEIDLVLV